MWDDIDPIKWLILQHASKDANESASISATVVESTTSTGYPEASIAAKETTALGDTLELTYEKLDAEAITGTVKDDGAGAIALFIGTTRDSFQGEASMGERKDAC